MDNRSLAPRHWARSRVSEPIAEVPDKSMVPAADRSLMTWVNSAWSMRSPDRSVWRTVAPIGAKLLVASTSVMLVPVPPKSHSAMTPRVGTPGSFCSAVSAAVASETNCAGFGT